MANDLNQCNFIGRLGQDPEIRHLPNGDAVANISIAVGERYKDKQSGQKVESTEWVRCVAFRKTAEIISEYLRKGSKVFVTGKMKTRKWQDQSGQDRYSTEIIINNMQMLDSKQDGQVSHSVLQQSATAQRPAQKPDGVDDFDDDIPF